MNKSKILAGILVIYLSVSFTVKESNAGDINSPGIVDQEAEINQKKKGLDQKNELYYK